MIPLVKMTPKQLENYRHIWGVFDGMNYIFGGPSGTLAFSATFHISEEGHISLEKLFVAHSCEHDATEMVEEIEEIRQKIASDDWEIVDQSNSRMEGVCDGLRLSFFSESTKDETIATHLLLLHGEPDMHIGEYFRHDFRLRSKDANRPPGKPASGYYPVGRGYSPHEAESIHIEELARRIRGKPLIAFTGAGISLSSGIPAFSGHDGLHKQLPIDDHRFPGQIADWIIHRPHKLAQILGLFHSRFITAQPNKAHLALAELEKRGTLKHIITGNFDMLHQRAGSQKVHISEPRYFKMDSHEGWGWIREGKFALVTGVSIDAGNGLLSYARDQDIQIVAIAPERPAFLYASDWFVQGRAEEVLPELEVLLRGGG